MASPSNPEHRADLLLPILVAHLDSEDARDYLEGAALANRTVHVPLVDSPMDRSPHLLEVITPGSSAPLLLIAHPVGGPTDKGFPLRLEPHSGTFTPESSTRTRPKIPSVSPPPAAVAAVAPSQSPPPPPLRPKKRTTAMTQELTKRHTQDLDGERGGGGGVRIARGVNADDGIDESLTSELVTDLSGRAIAGGKLIFEACVGSGGAGTVYRARHRDLLMSVAVKVMHESYQSDIDYCRRFHAEALSASRLDHPNLTRVLDFGQEPDGLLYLAMEYLDGQSLRDVLNDSPVRRLDFSRVAQLMIQVCSGLTHAHARKVVHRDIKPENIVLTLGLDDDGRETEVAKVCDFGIAHGAMTGQAAAFAGTPEYMAPEQLRGEPPNEQSDVYACGVVLYELLTGRVPIEGESVSDVFKKHQTEEPEPPSYWVSSIDPRVDRVVLKALAREREARHLNARELRNELRSIAEDIAVFTTGGYRTRDPSVVAATQSERGGVTSDSSAAWPAISSPPPSGGGGPSSSPGGDDWLERGRDYMTSMIPGAVAPSHAPPAGGSGQYPITGGRAGSNPPSAPPPTSAPPPVSAGSGSGNAPEPPEVTKVIVPFLQKLVAQTDPQKFAQMLTPLEPQIRKLAEHGYTTSLWRVRSTLDMIAVESGNAEQRERAAHAQLLLKVFGDPVLLGPLAERALDGLEDKERVASKLVVRAGYAGAHALYAARLKHGVFEARERFVSLIQEMGAQALPLIRAGLEMLHPKLGVVPNALQVAEDLLKAIPATPDDALGEIIARYARSQATSVAVLATHALPKVWGHRSRALLMALLGHPDDTVSVVALAKLRDLGALDEHIVRKLEPIILGTISTRPPMRIASGEALAFVSPDATPSAKKLLIRALEETTGNTPDAEDLTVCFANSLLALGDDGQAVVARWRTCTTWLRTRLEAVIRKYPHVRSS